MLCNDIFQHSINLFFMNLQLDYKNLSLRISTHYLNKEQRFLPLFRLLTVIKFRVL